MFLQKLREGYDIVSGWRKQRIDNFVMRRVPSKIANWLMAKLSGVELHDFGTTFKAYRREVVQEVPLYGELHRFIPALASAYGATICEVPIRNVNRERGESHYGISRTFRVFFDLITIRFLLKYMSRPLHFFGSIGMVAMLSGGGIGAWLALQKILNPSWDVMEEHGPLVVFAAVLILAGDTVAGLRTARRDAGAIPPRAAPRSLCLGTGAARRRARALPALRVRRLFAIRLSPFAFRHEETTVAFCRLKDCGLITESISRPQPVQFVSSISH